MIFFFSNCVSLGAKYIHIASLGESAYSRGIFFEEHFGGLGDDKLIIKRVLCD